WMTRRASFGETGLLCWFDPTARTGGFSACGRRREEGEPNMAHGTKAGLGVRCKHPKAMRGAAFGVAAATAMAGLVAPAAYAADASTDFQPGAQDGLIPVTSTAKAEHEIANGDNEDYDDAAYEGVELEPLQQVLGSAPGQPRRLDRRQGRLGRAEREVPGPGRLHRVPRRGRGGALGRRRRRRPREPDRRPLVDLGLRHGHRVGPAAQ